jgi:hypothetical protein
MGLDDRDYMRARYRRLQGIDDGPTIWNDKRGRVEMGQGSSWTNARWQMAGVGRALLQAILVPAVALGGMYVIYRTYTSVMTSAFQRMIPVPFPESGTVFTTPATDLNRRQGILRFRAPDRPNHGYVVVLNDVATDKDVLGIYVAGGKKTATPVQVGTYRVRIAEGLTAFWHGNDRLFGSTTAKEMMAPVKVVGSTDKTIRLQTGLARALEVKADSAKGFLE